MPREKQRIQGSVGSVCVYILTHAVISSIHWESWNVSPVDKGRPLYFIKVLCGDRTEQVQELRRAKEGWHAKSQGKRKVAGGQNLYETNCCSTTMGFCLCRQNNFTLSMLDCPCMVHRRPPIMVIRKLTSYIFECNRLTILSLDFSFHIAELCFHTCAPNIAI